MLVEGFTVYIGKGFPRMVVGVKRSCWEGKEEV